MVRAGRNAHEIMIPEIEVTGLGDYIHNEGYKIGSITYEFETKTFNYDRGIRLLADAMDVEEAGVLDCFVEAGSELQRTQVAPEGDAFTYATIASYDGINTDSADLSDAEVADTTCQIAIYHGIFTKADVSSYVQNAYSYYVSGLLEDVVTYENGQLVINTATTDEDGTVTTKAVSIDDVIAVSTDDGTEVHAIAKVDAVDATCTTAGNIEYYYCAYCNDYFIASTTSEGDYVKVSESDVITKAGNHNYVGTVTTEATCTTAGVITYTCSECGNTYTEAIAATGHSWGEPSEEDFVWADDYSSCSVVLTCTVCGETLTLDLAVTSETDADGNTVYTAYYDGDSVGVSLTATKTVAATTKTVTTTEASDGDAAEDDIVAGDSDEESELASTSDATTPLAAGAALVALAAAAGAVAFRRRVA